MGLSCGGAKQSEGTQQNFEIPSIEIRLSLKTLAAGPGGRAAQSLLYLCCPVGVGDGNLENTVNA